MKPPNSDRHADDGRLIRRAQAGDEEALAEIYRGHVQEIYRYILSRTGDEAVAEDLTSEVFLRAVEALPRYKHRGAPLAAWLYRIARDRVIDFHRANVRRPTTALDDDLLDSHPDLESILFEQAESARLRRAMRSLTQDQRDVLFFRFTEGFSIDQTATVMGKTVGAIKALQFRAVQALARKLK